VTEHTFTLAQMRQAMQERVESGHSVFAPSASKMWLNCPGSLIPNLFAPDDAGEDAAYGTVGHMVGETWLRDGKKPSDLLGTKHRVEAGEGVFVIEVDDVMMEYVRQYVKYCENLPGQHFVEVRVDFSRLTPIPNQGGTADHAACSPGLLVITDLKMGKGVRVYAEKNTQAMLYALGFFYKWDWLYGFKKITVRIAQPRMDNWDTWDISREELLAFAEDVKIKAAAAWVQNAPRRASPEACQWCRVQATCTAKAIAVVKLTEGIFGDTTEVTEQESNDLKMGLRCFKDYPKPPVDVHTLSTYDMEVLYNWRGSVEQFFKKVGEELMRRARNGHPLDMYKQVEGVSHRAWRNQKKTLDHLVSLGLKREDLLSEVIPSPAQVEDLLRKAGYKTKELPGLLDGLFFKPPGGATLALKTDRRPALGDKFEDVFSDTSEL
jgi:hypothetical protein